jgi:hypothetical protein
MQYTPDELGGEDDGGPALVDDGFATRANGQADLSQMTEQEKEDAGLMGRAQRVEHEGLRRALKDGQPRAERLHEPDPDDPWAEPAAPAETTSGPAAKREPPQPLKGGSAKRLEGLWEQIGISDEERADLIAWLTPGWSGTFAEIRTLYTFLEDHLHAAGGDVESARSDIWAQYREANPEASDG